MFIISSAEEEEGAEDLCLVPRWFKYIAYCETVLKIIRSHEMGQQYAGLMYSIAA